MQGEYNIVVTLGGKKYILGKNKDIFKIDDLTKEFSDKDALSKFIIETFHQEFKENNPNSIFDTIEIRYPDHKGKTLDVIYSSDVIDEEKIKNAYFYYLFQNQKARQNLAYLLCRGLQLAVDKNVDFVPVSSHEMRCHDVYYDKIENSKELKRVIKILINTYLTSYRRYRDVYFLLKKEGQLLSVKDLNELNILIENFVNDNVPLEEINKFLHWNLEDEEYIGLRNLRLENCSDIIKLIIKNRGSRNYVSSGLHKYITLILMKEQNKSRR